MAWNRRLLSPEVLHVDGGDVERRVEAVARQVARVDTAPSLRSTWPTAKVLQLAWRWPPELTMIWVYADGAVGAGGVEGGAGGWSSPPLPTTICEP